jgi:hypothetical protein
MWSARKSTLAGCLLAANGPAVGRIGSLKANIRMLANNVGFSPG